MRSLLILALLVSVAQGQSITYKVFTAINPVSKDTYAIPIFESPSNPAIADSINTDLVADLLEGNFHQGLDSLFVNVWPTEEQPHMARLYLYGFEILHNGSNILSIAIDGEGCGAYCEGFTAHYNYDLRTGKRIQISSLFNKPGLRQLAAVVTAAQIKRMKEEIRSLRQDLRKLKKSKNANPDDIEADEGSIELFEECSESIGSDLDNWEKYADYNQLFLTPKKFCIFLGRCSAHVNRAEDTIGDFAFTYPIKRWQPYLSPYAKSLFGLK